MKSEKTQLVFIVCNDQETLLQSYILCQGIPMKGDELYLNEINVGDIKGFWEVMSVSWRPYGNIRIDPDIDFLSDNDNELYPILIVRRK